MIKRIIFIAVMVVCFCGIASADPTWYTISFTGTDMFNYTTSVAPRADQDAPRRLRDWTVNASEPDTLNYKYESYLDADSDGTNDFAEWASGNLASYGFSYFNLWGETIPSNSWDQPYQAVPDQSDGKYGVESWRNQTFPTGWTGGIVMANQYYNATDHAFPVWRAPTGEQLTMANAASLQFSVDVLMENYSAAFEPDGRLRVWFGGYDTPQDTLGHTQEVSGIMLVPIPAAVLLGMLGFGVAGLKLRKFA